MRLLTVLILSIFIATGCKSGGGGGGGQDGTTDTDASIRDPQGGSGDGTGDGNVTDGDTPAGDPNCVEKIGLNKVLDKEVIIGDNTWVPSSTITDKMMKANAQATVYVRMSASRCTGFLVADDIIMTNNHCIANQSQANGVYVRFDWLSANGSYKQYTCDEFIGTNAALDFTLVRCKGNPGKNHPQVILGSYQGKTGYPIYIPHQNCDYRYGASCSPTQKLSTGSLTGYNSSQVNHNADTLGGSSGSPIFDKESHKVIAIHNAGMNTSNGGGTNYGIQMYRIVDYIKDYFPQVEINASTSRAPAYDVCD